MVWLRHRTDAPTDFDWTNTQLPDILLGIYVGNTACTDKNIEHKLHKLRNIIATWKHRDLSLKGRALVINGLLTSTLWYQAANIHFPTWAIQEIEDLIYNFMWNGKRPLINRDILALPLAGGGLNILDSLRKYKLFALTPSDAYSPMSKHIGNTLHLISYVSHTCPLANTHSLLKLMFNISTHP